MQLRGHLKQERMRFAFCHTAQINGICNYVGCTVPKRVNNLLSIFNVLYIKHYTAE